MDKKINLIFDKEIEIELKDKTKGFNLYVKNLTFGDIIKIGHEEYQFLVSQITTRPKDISDILWNKGVWYRDLSDYGYFCSRLLFENNDTTLDKENDNKYLTKALRLFLGDYIFVISLDEKLLNKRGLGEKVSDEDLFTIYIFSNDKKRQWLGKISPTELFEIQEVMKKINLIPPSELSTWNYGENINSEKQALKFFYKERTTKSKEKEESEISLESIYLFLQTETSIPSKELLEKTFYEFKSLYFMKVMTLRTRALNQAIYTNGVERITPRLEKDLTYARVVSLTEKSSPDIETGNVKANIKGNK